MNGLSLYDLNVLWWPEIPHGYWFWYEGLTMFFIEAFIWWMLFFVCFSHWNCSRKGHLVFRPWVYYIILLGLFGWSNFICCQLIYWSISGMTIWNGILLVWLIFGWNDHILDTLSDVTFGVFGYWGNYLR